METIYATLPTPGQTNEDIVIAGPSWAFVLDGATAPAGIPSGCIHDVTWFVRHLGGHLARLLTLADDQPVTDLLADALRCTGREHADTCDLDNPSSPNATAVIVRERGDQMDYLALSDSPLVLDRDGEVQVIKDSRTERLPDYSPSGVARVRNQPGGFWVAGAQPHAAHEAVTGSVPLASVRRAALLSDGAARLVERFNILSWNGLLDVLEHQGPAELIARTRHAEEAERAAEREGRRGKRYDDATAVYLVTSPWGNLRSRHIPPAATSTATATR